MKIKVNDQVKILAGKDKGKTGKVIKTLKKENKVVVEGINLIKKHQKPRYTNESGSILTVEAPINVSNVKKIEETKEKATKKVAKVSKEAKVVSETKEEKKETKKTTAKKTTKKAKES